MVKHIVLFQLSPDMDPALKQQVMHDFKTAIETLPATIPFLRSVEVGINITPS